MAFDVLLVVDGNFRAKHATSASHGAELLSSVLLLPTSTPLLMPLPLPRSCTYRHCRFRKLLHSACEARHCPS
jgi:hypothetical protein